MKTKHTKAINTNLDAYLVERLASFSDYTKLTRTQVLTLILDQFFANLDRHASDAEMVRYFRERDIQFVRENTSYRLDEYQQLPQLYNNGAGYLCKELNKREEGIS